MRPLRSDFSLLSQIKTSPDELTLQDLFFINYSLYLSAFFRTFSLSKNISAILSSLNHALSIFLI